MVLSNRSPSFLKKSEFFFFFGILAAFSLTFSPVNVSDHFQMFLLFGKLPTKSMNQAVNLVDLNQQGDSERFIGQNLNISQHGVQWFLKSLRRLDKWGTKVVEL